jgi:hypothetical protein
MTILVVYSLVFVSGSSRCTHLELRSLAAGEFRDTV